MLENIHSPKDLKGLSKKELEELCGEIRNKILKTVSENGGHLGSNLGITEAVVMLHRLFDSPYDSIIFDVSHQCYAHKLLTGRYESFDTLRKTEGISGFTNRAESEHDVFTFGHSGSALSAALGMARAKKLRGSDSWTVAVVGDASCSNGMVFEALNSITDKNLKLLILINDNGMSISKNRGKLSKNFSAVRTSRKYLRLKHSTEKSLSKIPLIGKALVAFLKKLKHLLRFVVYKDSLFESLRLDYIGPVDGNSLERLEAVLSEVKRRGMLTVVHMITKKGKGYEPAEREQEKYHAVGPFDIEKGAQTGGGGFSAEFGRLLCECAVRDERICAVTAAMSAGTGLDVFERSYPERFFDAGIAEEHALTFCCGLARMGLKPVFAVYSTFLQRCYDQLVHDAALQGLSLVLAIDRAGLVSGDGATHHGVLDCAMLTSVPGTAIWSPSTYAELEECMDTAVRSEGISAVRYPRGKEQADSVKWVDFGNYKIYDNAVDSETAIIVWGRLTSEAVRAADIVGSVRVIKLIKLYPIDIEVLSTLLNGIKLIYIPEEAMRSGCLADKYRSALCGSTSARVVIKTLGDSFMPHGSLDYLYKLAGIDAESMAEEIKREKGTKA